MMPMTRMLVAFTLAVVMLSPGAGAQTSPASAAVHVVTYIDIAPEYFARARPLLLHYRDIAAKSAGSAAISLFQEFSRPGRIVVRETWADQQAFDAHGKSQAATALAAGLKPFELAPPDQRVHLDFGSGAGAAIATGSAIHVFSHVDVPPPRQGDLEPMLKALQAASLKVPTAVRFEVLQQSNRKNHFTVAETWANRNAFEVQAQSSEQRNFRKNLGPMLGALYDQRLYRTLR